MEGKRHGTEDGRRDEELMAAVAREDPEAFRELFRRYAGRLFAYCRAMNRDSESSRDLVQEAFVKVWRARKRYDPSRPFRAWIFMIASRLNTDLIRSWAWKLRRISGAAGMRDGSALDGIAAPASAGPESAAESAELSDKLRRELPKLPAREREAIVLHDLEGLTCRETAEVMGSPLGSVLSWLSRGRQALRARLEAMGGWENWA